MKSLFAFFVATAIPFGIASAAYVPTSVIDLAGTSEGIAVGTIVKVEKETVALKVEDLLVGSGKVGETITVQRFRDWPCAWRWSPYVVGQKVLVFLDFDAETKEWVIRGAGREGESPIVGDDVYANFRFPGKPIKFGDSPYGKVYLVAVPYNQLRTAILDFRKSYRLTRASNPWRIKNGEYEFMPFDRIERIVGPRTSQFRPRHVPPEFENRSVLHRYLAQAVEEETNKLAKFNEQDVTGRNPPPGRSVRVR